jgi:16S rRNA (adenine1518-N6/adenine1519-N6)-dimethyltransferase
VDAAFAQRRKALRGALRRLAGSAESAEQALHAAGVDPMARGEQLAIADFARIAGELPWR